MRNPRNDPLEGHSPERTCILSRRTAPKEDLIRLALSPEGEVAPDVRARAPGRGAWIGVSRAQLDAAHAKGKLKSALARAFKANDVKIPANLGERLADALRQAALDRLGMEARAGNLINGADKVETAARAGKVHLIIHAADAGEDGRRRLDQAWRVGGGRAAGLGISGGSHHLVIGARTRKCGTCRADRSRRRAAGEPCHRPVACFHCSRCWARGRLRRRGPRHG